MKEHKIENTESAWIPKLQGGIKSKDLKVVTACDYRKRIFACPGNRFKDVYKPLMKDDGTVVLESIDKMDQYEYIQSFKDSCDINKLLERFAETGDMTLFNQRRTEPVYADLIEMPKTFAELYQRVIDVTDAFMRLDPKIREKFNNSPAEWISAYGSPEFSEKMGFEMPGVQKDDHIPGQIEMKEVNKDE